MNKEVPLKEIVTVSEMSRMCRLSRARFYQLVSEGVFPTPSRDERTGRPFFNRGQQEQCLEIRRSNRGANGKAVMFYGCRPQLAQKTRSKRKQLPISKSSESPKTQDPAVAELRHGLAQLGIGNVTEQTIRESLAPAYPDGHQNVESAELLRTVFGAILCRNTADKLSG